MNASSYQKIKSLLDSRDLPDHTGLIPDIANVTPALPCVIMKDRCMSGWGYAKGKMALYVVICDDMGEAETIYRNANLRGEMSRIRIIGSDQLKSEIGPRHQFTVKMFDDMGGKWKAPESDTDTDQDQDQD